jgi:predicted ATPase
VQCIPGSRLVVIPRPHISLTPPWPEIYLTDSERRHGFNTALTEHSRLVEVYPSLGYDLVVLPKVGVADRANLVLTMLAQ